MQIDEFLELVRKRRSIRKFKPDPVPDAYIEKIIEAARWAMSGANGQPWEFIVVKNKKTIKKIAEIYHEGQKNGWAIENTRIPELRHRQFAGRPPPPPGFKDAPVLIIVCGDPRTYMATVLSAHFLVSEGGTGEATYLKNVANATQNLHLAAAALGLGAQWVSWRIMMEAPLRALLDIPEELTIHTVVPIGYSAYVPVPPFRREIKEIVHYEKYDRSKFRSIDDVIEFVRKLRLQMRPAYPRVRK